MKIKYPLTEAYIMPAEEVVHALQSDANNGISEAEAEKRTKEFGSNVYQARKQRSILLILLEQFRSPIVYLLAFGVSVSVYFKDMLEAIAISVVILVNALIGFLMELQARSSMNALKEMDVIHSNVIRDGKIRQIPSEQINPGDVVLLEAGDVIPGDGRLVESNQLQCDESSLTGESIPSVKDTGKLPKDTLTGDKLNMVFKGSAVMNGKGKAVITGIANNTELGKITSLVDSSANTITPLDRKINALSKKLIWITLIMTFTFAITGLIQGKKWLLLIETSIALAVAAIPEGLPIVSTVALAYGMLRMARRNAIVKKLSSVETLGSTNVILTDKTGTLTENKIHVASFSFPEETLGVRIDNNKLLFNDSKIEKSHENFEKMKIIGALCNDASVDTAGVENKSSGDPLEIALIHLANASGTLAKTIKEQYERIAEKPFSSVTKIMGTLHKSPSGYFVAAKGAVENLVEKCNRIQLGASIIELSKEARNKILLESEKISGTGLRVLAFAYREDALMNQDNYLNDLIYVGIIGFLDPPRLDIKEAITSCRKAGIRVVMITGDHPLTALNIARKTGLVDSGEQRVITGKDIPPMDSLSDEWKKKILSTAVFARTTPQQKLDIADIYQKAGNIVAMTGDGVNDAPALRKADVGIAMGLRGTAVAKEAAGIVLKDDSFVSIAEAVAQGRTIFKNIKKFVVYLVSCNLSEILIITILGFIAPASTLLPLQILYLNMVTDIFPALALGVGKGNKSVMEKPPEDPGKPIITNRNWLAIAIYSITITLSVILAITYCRLTITTDSKTINNVAFLTLALSQLFHVFNMASIKSGVFSNEITKNKFVWMAILLCIGLMLLAFNMPEMRLVLDLVVPTGKIWTVSVLAGILPLLLVQVYKSVMRISKQIKSYFPIT